jgi:hypothetical protein
MKRNFRLIGLLLTMFSGITLFQSCSKDESIGPQINERADWATSDAQAGTSATDVTFYGLTSKNELVGFSTSPVEEKTSVPITGLADREQMMAIDFSSTTGGLYGISNMSLFYAIDPATGKAQAVSSEPISPAVYGSTVGFDFDPRTATFRVMTDAETNVKIDPATGKVVGAEWSTSAIDYSINGIAYMNNFNSSTTGTMFAVDTKDGMLYRGSSTFSSMQKVGSLGLTTSGEGGFDINRDNSLALAVLYGHSTTPVFSATDDLSQDKYRLYNISLRTGQAQYMGVMSREVIGIAMPTK